jgi:hypothetical protein
MVCCYNHNHVLSNTAFQVGHITADNTSNNDTMMEFFAKYSTEGIDRDEIGLVRAIAVKVWTAHPTHPTYSECWSGMFICETQRTFLDSSSRESCLENQNGYEQAWRDHWTGQAAHTWYAYSMVVHLQDAPPCSYFARGLLLFNFNANSFLVMQHKFIWYFCVTHGLRWAWPC